MDLHEGNDVGFFKLVRNQREHRDNSTQSLFVKGKASDSENSIRSAWADYFEDLASPTNNEHFDSNFYKVVENDITSLNYLVSKTTIT